MGQLSIIDIPAVLVYATALVVIGIASNRRTKDSEDYFLAGRSITWFPASISIMMTLISTISYLANPSNVFRAGLVAVSGIFCVFLVVPVTVTVGVYAPFFTRLRITSAYEYLEMRYNVAMRVTGAGLFIFLRVTYLVFPTAAEVQSQKFLTISIVSLGVIAVGYTALGGIRAVIWTDVMQFFVLLAGAVLTIVLGIDYAMLVSVSDRSGTYAAMPGKRRCLIFRWISQRNSLSGA